MTDNTEYLDFAKNLAKEAGQIMKSYFRTQKAQPDWKNLNDPVTLADKTINAFVIEQVKATYKDHGILGEEDTYKPDSKYLWVVDPIDGTIPFILGMPISTFLIALVVEGRPIVGVAYNPWIDLFYYAQAGKGAFCGDIKLKMTEPKTRFVEHIYWHGSLLREELMDVREKLEAKDLSPQNFAGGNSRFGLAENLLYGVIYGGKDPWDTAVLDLVVSEAGGKVTDIDGQPIDFRGPIRGTVAGTKQTHAELMNIIKS